MIRLLALPLLLAACVPRSAPEGRWRDSAEAPRDPPSFALSELAGRYSQSVMFSGGWLRIEPEGRWSYAEYACMGKSAECSGVARVSGGTLVLEKSDAFGFPTGDFVALMPLRWGMRLYLLLDGDYLEFCNSINEGYEPDRDEMGRAWLRNADVENGGETIAISGDPELPPEWRARILRQPVEGQIVEVFTDGTMGADVGTADGVYVGLLMQAKGPEWHSTMLEVTQVDEHTCRLNFAWSSPGLLPEAGWPLKSWKRFRPR